MTIYIGYTCTLKYVSNPTTVHDDTTSIAELPLQWSICKQFKVATYTKGGSNIFGSLLGEYYTSDAELEYEVGTIPNHAKSKDAFWKLLEDNHERFTANEFVKYIELWNSTSKEWMRIFGDSRDTKEDQKMFR